MRSSAGSEVLDLERDLPTTPADVAALRRARAAAPLDFAGYLRFLAAWPSPPTEALRSRRGPHGRPFELAGV